MKWQPYGPGGILIQFADEPNDDSFLRARAVQQWLETHPLPGLIDVVPAFTTLLIELDPHSVADLSKLGNELVQRLSRIAVPALAEAPVHDVPIRYDGPDLSRVAEHNHLSQDEVIQRHLAPVYKIYCLGFAPGFPYLGDLDPKLHTPRLPSPRPRLAAGSVAIGGSHTAIYSIASPGGWNVIGSTDLPLFRIDHSAEEMFPIRPGDRLRFIPQ